MLTIYCRVIPYTLKNAHTFTSIYLLLYYIHTIHIHIHIHTYTIAIHYISYNVYYTLYVHIYIYTL